MGSSKRLERRTSPLAGSEKTMQRKIADGYRLLQVGNTTGVTKETLQLWLEEFGARQLRRTPTEMAANHPPGR